MSQAQWQYQAHAEPVFVPPVAQPPFVNPSLPDLPPDGREPSWTLSVAVAITTLFAFVPVVAAAPVTVASWQPLLADPPAVERLLDPSTGADAPTYPYRLAFGWEHFDYQLPPPGAALADFSTGDERPTYPYRLAFGWEHHDYQLPQAPPAIADTATGAELPTLVPGAVQIYGIQGPDDLPQALAWVSDPDTGAAFPVRPPFFGLGWLPTLPDLPGVAPRIADQPTTAQPTYPYRLRFGWEYFDYQLPASYPPLVDPTTGAERPPMAIAVPPLPNVGWYPMLPDGILHDRPPLFTWWMGGEWQPDVPPAVLGAFDDKIHLGVENAFSVANRPSVGGWTGW